MGTRPRGKVHEKRERTSRIITEMWGKRKKKKKKKNTLTETLAARSGARAKAERGIDKTAPSHAAAGQKKKKANAKVSFTHPRKTGSARTEEGKGGEKEKEDKKKGEVSSHLLVVPRRRARKEVALRMPLLGGAFPPEGGKSG